MREYNKRFIYFICMVSAMGGLLFGYDWVVIGGAKPFYELYFGISESPLMQGVAMTTALVGCLVGAMVAGAAADKYGRKPLLSPMYIAEVSPAAIRGRMVSLNQMTIVLGILGAQIVNMLLARDTSVVENQAWNVEWGWRWMFWAETVPAALFLLMSFFIPESPVFTKMKEGAAVGDASMSQHGVRLCLSSAPSHSQGEQEGVPLRFSAPERETSFDLCLESTSPQTYGLCGGRCLAAACRSRGGPAGRRYGQSARRPQTLPLRWQHPRRW